MSTSTTRGTGTGRGTGSPSRLLATALAGTVSPQVYDLDARMR